MLIAFTDITNIEEPYFEIERYDSFASSINPATSLSINFSMNMDAVKVTRSVYTFFDLLGNVGGLAGILFSIVAFLHSICKFNASENSLVEQLYQEAVDTDLPKASAQSSCKEYLWSCFPSCLLPRSRCLRERQKDKLYAMGRDLLVAELDVVKMLRVMRFNHLALKRLLGQDVMDEISSVTVKKPLNEGGTQRDDADTPDLGRHKPCPMKEEQESYSASFSNMPVKVIPQESFNDRVFDIQKGNNKDKEITSILNAGEGGLSDIT